MPPENKALKTPVVFLVDDDAAVREAVSLLLKSSGLECLTFPSGEDFLSAYDPDQPGCLVTDVGSTKAELERILGPLAASAGADFVGSHPVCGSDEQGIDSLWVQQEFQGGQIAPVDSVTITANLDTAEQIVAKRSWKVAMSIPVDNCDFDVVVGARDVAGRISEFRAGVLFSTSLFANEVPVSDGDVVDATTAFRHEIRGCEPLAEPLDVQVLLDGNAIAEVSSVQFLANSRLICCVPGSFT